MSINRETVRDGLVALLETALVGEGLPCQAVYGYRIGDFAGASPVVVVSSDGIQHERMTFQGSKGVVYLQVDVFVWYGDGVTWTEAQAEDALDDIEQRIYDVLDGNAANALWKAINYQGRTQRMDVAVGGVQFIRETMTVAAVVYA